MRGHLFSRPRMVTLSCSFWIGSNLVAALLERVAEISPLSLPHIIQMRPSIPVATPIAVGDRLQRFLGAPGSSPRA